MRHDSEPRVRRARALRGAGNDAEDRLWRALRGRAMSGHKFRRQHPVGPFFADFACLAAGLIVEVDGAQHADRIAYDARRTRHLEAQGFRVMRFGDRQVLTELPAVLETIRLAWEAGIAGRISPGNGHAARRGSEAASNPDTAPHPDPHPPGGARENPRDAT